MSGFDPVGVAIARRRASRQLEAEQQRRFCAMLNNLADPATTFWTALENKPRSLLAGMLQKDRGVRAGMPDHLIINRGRPVFIEFKSLGGEVNKRQRAIRAELIAAGAEWWMVRSANAAMVALHLSGVRFRKRMGRKWKPPLLADWERPRRDPSIPGRRHPTVRERERLSKARQRARRKQAGQQGSAVTPAGTDDRPGTGGRLTGRITPAATRAAGRSTMRCERLR